MKSESGDRTWSPDAVRIWDGPRIHDGHRLLIDACLDGDLVAATEAWRRWHADCDFEHEDGGSYELAAVAVERLGASAGDSSVVARCGGWARRARVISTLCLDAARRAATVVRDAGFETIAVGDLAEHGATGRTVRCVELLAVGVPEEVLVAARAATGAGPAAATVDAGRIPFGLGPNAAWHGRWFDASRRPIVACASPDADGPAPWRLPIREEIVAMLLARGWRWRPPGGPRWVLSVHRVLSGGEPVEPGLVVAAAERDGTVTLLRHGFRLLGSLRAFHEEPVAGRLAAIEVALDGARCSIRDRWRAARAVRPPAWWFGRAVDSIRGRGTSFAR